MECVKIEKEYYCGVDLHSRCQYLCLMEHSGKIVFHQNLKNDISELKEAISPYLGRIAIGVESTYNWYWLADACEELDVEFYLGHALYMSMIHGGKNKNDRIDSKKIADLLRCNLFPVAYVYPKEMRATRDLLRRRHRYVSLRAEAYTHLQNLFTQQGFLQPLHNAVKNKGKRWELPEQFEDPDLSLCAESDLKHIESMARIIATLETQINQRAHQHNARDYALLKTIPGVGTILSLSILYETHTIGRFATVQKYSSYCRLVKPQRSSNGKNTGGGNSKIGNPYLKNTFNEIINVAQRESPGIKKYYQKLQSKQGVRKARAIVAHKFAIATYYLLKHSKGFDEKRFLGG